VEIVPMDPILKAALDHRSDTDPKKMNLSIGAYRDDNGQPYIFPVVRKVEQEILSEGLDKVTLRFKLRSICSREYRAFSVELKS
jgi:aspartate/tyrosine/aromatic aminotransferase